nr:unnamed protein product [Digitaria exilis]
MVASEDGASAVELLGRSGGGGRDGPHCASSSALGRGPAVRPAKRRWWWRSAGWGRRAEDDAMRIAGYG